MNKKSVKIIIALLSIFLNINYAYAGSFKKFMKKAFKQSIVKNKDKEINNNTKNDTNNNNNTTPANSTNTNTARSSTPAYTTNNSTSNVSSAENGKYTATNNPTNSVNTTAKTTSDNTVTSNIVSIGNTKYTASNYRPSNSCNITYNGKNIVLQFSNGVKLDMIFCPEGKFIKGCPAEEIGGNDGFTYRPTETFIRQYFYIGKYEVTQAQYKAVTETNPSRFEGDNLPVQCVSFEDARKFCEKLNSICSNSIPSGYKFDLPSDAHWEYACRAGTTTPLYNGKSLINGYKEDPNLNSLAWYSSNSGDKPHQVGQKTPNSWGLYDMYGNVGEWTRHWNGYDSAQAVTDTVRGTNQKMVRGGTFVDWPACCRSAYRDMYTSPIVTYDYTTKTHTNEHASRVGFRLALVPIDM